MREWGAAGEGPSGCTHSVCVSEKWIRGWGWFVSLFFLILTSQSLLLEQLLSLQLLWESMLLTELSRSCRWLISREGHMICLCANSV